MTKYLLSPLAWLFILLSSFSSWGWELQKYDRRQIITYFGYFDWDYSCIYDPPRTFCSHSSNDVLHGTVKGLGYDGDPMVAGVDPLVAEATIEYRYGKKHGAFRYFGQIFGYGFDGEPSVPFDPFLLANPYSARYYTMMEISGQYSNDRQCGPWKYDDFYNSDGRFPPPGTPPRESVIKDYGPCEPLQIDDMEDPENEKEIRGHVIAKETGKPIAGAAVQVKDRNTKSSEDGSFFLTIPPQDAAILTCNAAGYMPYTLTLDLAGLKEKSLTISLKTQRDKPAILKVDSQYDGFFLDWVSFNNTYTAQIDWHGDPGIVKFQANGSVFEEKGSKGSTTHTFDMGFDFQPSLSATGNTIRITAINAAGEKSDPEILYPLVISPPAWSLPFGSFKAEGLPGQASYALSTDWPPLTPFSFKFSQQTFPRLWEAWSYVPIVGGYPFGLDETQATMDMELETTGAGSVKFSGNSKVAAAGAEFGAVLGGGGPLVYKPNEGVKFTGADLTMGASGGIERTESLLNILKPLKLLLKIKSIGRALQRLDKVAEIAYSLEPSQELTLHIVENNGAVDFASEEYTFGFEMAGALGPREPTPTKRGKKKAPPPPAFQFERTEGGIEASFSFEGRVEGTFQVPTKNNFLKVFEAELSGNLELRWLIFQKSIPFSIFFSNLDTTFMQAASTTEENEDFAVIGREFLTTPYYSKFNSRPSPLPIPDADAAINKLTAPVKVVENIYPHAQPALAVAGERAAIAYVYFDPAKTTTQATEIALTYYNGTEYSQPKLAANDTNAEFSPTIAFTKDGKVVAAWERVKDPAFVGTTIDEMAAQLEIVSAVFDPATGTWSTPVALTDNNYLDHSPELQRNANGDLLLTWRSNAGDELIGDATYPSSVHYSFWNGTSFDSPKTLAHPFVDSHQFATAYYGNNAILVYAQDMDGDLSTREDGEIFYFVYNTGVWQGPMRLTENQVEDSSPKVVSRSDGGVELLWQQGGALVRLTDWQTHASQLVQAEGDSRRFTDYQLTVDPGNNLLLTWTGSDAVGPAIGYRVFSAADSTWSEDLLLAAQGGVEKNIRTAFSASGLFHTLLLDQDPATGRTDLLHLTKPFFRNLTISAESLKTEPLNPAPGMAATATVAVTNSGDLPLQGAEVTFYLGTPGAGGLVLGRTPVSPALLNAGATGQATLAWTVPAGNETALLSAVVNEDKAIAEDDLGDNTASLVALRPELSLASVKAEGIGNDLVAITTLLRNSSGSITAKMVTVRFKANNQILADRLVPSLAPGQGTDLSLDLGADKLSGSQIEIETIVDPDNKIMEFDKANNSRKVIHQRVPRLTPEVSSVDFVGITVGSSAIVQKITLWNKGTDCTMGQLHIDGAAAGEFTLQNDTCSNKLVTTGSCTVDVLYTSTTAGERAAVLIIPSDDLDQPELSLPLHASDASPLITFTRAGQEVNEVSGTVGVTVALSGISNVALTVPFAVGGTATGSGVDHDLIDGNLTIPAGKRSATFWFKVLEDEMPEPDETVIITLGAAATTATGAGNTHTVTIKNVNNSWEQHYPLPAIKALWGESEESVFAVGERGSIQHYDGNTWQAMASVTNKTLNGIWGTSGPDLFTVGEAGTVLHFDGSLWQVMDAGTNQDLYGIWGSAHDNIFAVGAGGTIIHYDGSRWSAMAVPLYNRLTAIWGADATTVFAVGELGVILRYDGTTWNAVIHEDGCQFTALWGSSSHDLYAASTTGLYHFNGITWRKTDQTGAFMGLWGTSPTRVFASGDYGKLYCYNGTSWTQETKPVGLSNTALNTLWGKGGLMIAGGSSGIIMHNSGTAWTLDTPLPFRSDFRGVWGSGPDNVFAVGGNGSATNGTIFHYDGSGWAKMSTPVICDLNSVWGSGPEDIVAVGNGGTALHYDGQSWRLVATGTTKSLYGVWGSGGVYYAIGPGVALAYRDGVWKSMEIKGTESTFQAIWGVSNAQLYAVTEGCVWKSNGTSWEQANAAEPCTSNGGLRTIWGAGVNDIYVSNAYSAYHFNGTVTTKIEGSPTEIKALWGVGGGELYAAGYLGTVSRYDGEKWTKMTTHNSSGLYGLWGSSVEDLFAVGAGGTILHHPLEPRLQVGGPLQVNEGDGNLSGQGVIYLPYPTPHPLSVAIVSDHPDLVAVPAQLTVAQGQQSIAFDLVVGDNALLDGYREVTVTATAPGFSPGQAVLGVNDNEPAHLALEAPATVAEADGRLEGLARVTIDTVPGQDLVIVLSSADSSAIILPRQVTIKAGETSALIPLTVIDDSELDGSRQVKITAGGIGAQPVSATLSVTDNDRALGLALPPEMQEGEQGQGAVFIPAPCASDLLLSLSVTPVGAATLPATVTIPAGSRSVFFPLAALDNTVERDDRKGITITAAALGWLPDAGSMLVRNNDPVTIEFSSGYSDTSEEQGLLFIFVERSAPVNYESTVRYRLSGGNATPGRDFLLPASDLLVFGPGEIRKLIRVEILKDIVTEEAESFTLTLDNPQQAALGASYLRNNTVTIAASTFSPWQTLPNQDKYAINAFWGDETGQVFGVGDTIVRYDGSQWASMLNPGRALHALWGSTATDLFAVGQGVLHYDGMEWTSMEQPASKMLLGVWGSGASDVYAVGEEGIFHYNGAAWEEVLRGTGVLRSVWGSAATDIFAAGDKVMLHYDGYVWAVMEFPANKFSVISIWGSSAYDVYALGSVNSVGGENALWHYDGTAWTPMAIPPLGSYLYQVWGAGLNDLYMTGSSGVAHYDGASWTVQNIPLRTLGGGGKGLYAVTQDGAGYTLVNNQWCRSTIGSGDISKVWALSPTNLYAIVMYDQKSTIYHYDGTGWRVLREFAESLFDIWGNSGKDIYVVGKEGRIFHFDGTAWAEQETSPLWMAGFAGNAYDDFRLNGVWGSSSQDVYAVGQGYSKSQETQSYYYSGGILHYDGTSWIKTGWPTPLTSILGFGSNDIFVAGHKGTILHYDGTGWNSMLNPLSNSTTNLLALWGNRSGNLYAAGDKGVILHYDGTTWTQITSPTTNTITSLWGNGEATLFIPGFLYDGTAWSKVAAPPAGFITDFWGTKEGEVFGFGGAKMYRYVPATPALALTLPQQATEGERLQGALLFDTPLTETMTIQLAADPAAALTLPDSITAAVGAMSADFEITVVADLLLKGTQPVAVTAYAAGLEPQAAFGTILITYHECNGQTGDGAGGPISFYQDGDDDGYGDPANSRKACVKPAGYVADNSDCNDRTPWEHPGQAWYRDGDGDTYGDPATATQSCTQPPGYVVDNTDCSDADATDHESVWFKDMDNDGYSDGTTAGVSVVNIFDYPPHSLTNLNGTLYFVADDGIRGEELWMSDGSAVGTILVKDIRVGTSGSSPENVTNVNGVLYFSASDAVNGRELWKSDGTAQGTVMVKDICPGKNGSFPNNFTKLGEVIYFTADNGTSGRELWKSDGTEAGTVMVKDIYAGANESSVKYLTSVNGILYFSAADGVANGSQLWKSDGTTGGTVMVKKIGTSGSSSPANFLSMNGVLYFSASDGVFGGLWKSDGTASGTVKVTSQVDSVGNITDVNGTLFFTANNNWVNGSELWKSDGTSAGTVLVRDIKPGASDSYPEELTNVNGVLYFSADDGVNGRELWQSDGTAVGTVMVKDLYPGMAPNSKTEPNDSTPYFLTEMNGLFYFVARDEVDYGLWQSDGSAAGTAKINLTGEYGFRSPGNSTNVNGVLYFAATDSEGYVDGLWKYEGRFPCTRPAGYKLASELTATSGDCDDSAPDRIAAGMCGCGVAETDTDSDGTPDCNDACPSDPNKTQQGTCGCGVAETDTDKDRTRDCMDSCPNDPAKIEPGLCGCGAVDTDTDKDGTPDCNDACPTDQNKTQPGTCGCGVADTDTDKDGTPDCKDAYPFEPLAINRSIAGQVTDQNGQGLAGIKVEALSLAIDRSYVTTSDEDGVYRIDVAMAPDYLVSASGAGTLRHYYDDAHSWAEAERVNVVTGDRLGVDFALEAGSPLRGVLHGLGAEYHASVEAWSESTHGWAAVAVTGTGGDVDFVLEGLAPATDYVLYIHAEGSLTGYLTADGRIDSWKPEPCHEAGGDDPIEIQLPTGHAITGTISGLTAGTSALVTAWDQAGVVQGSSMVMAAAAPLAYTITGLVDGIYLVAIETEGYAGGYWAGTLAGMPAAPGIIDTATPVVVSGQDATGINFAVTPGHILSGTVLGLGQGEEVIFSAWSDTTGAWQNTIVVGAGGGSDPFTLTGLNAVDDYFLYVDSAKYRCGYLGGGQITTEENADRFNAAGDPADILINLTTGKSLSGLVWGLDQGEAAVLEAWSDKTGSWGSTVVLGTGADVAYTITNLAPARDFVVTFAPDWHLGSIHPGVDTTGNARGIDFTASRAVGINGTIVNGGNNATIVVAAWSAEIGAYHQEAVMIGANGSAVFALTGLTPAADYLVMALAGTEIVYYGEAAGPGKRTVVDVSQGNATGITLDFSVLTSHTLTAVIAGVAGRTPVRLEAWNSDGVQRAAERAGNGGIQLDLPAGQYKISISADGYVPTYYVGPGIWKNDLGAATLADLQTGDPNLGTITLTRGFTVAGTVCLDNNNDGLCGSSEGVASTQVEMVGNNLTFQASVTTDNRGRYRIEGLPNGNYTLRVWTIEGKDSRDVTIAGQNQSGTNLLLGGTGTGAAVGTVTVNGTPAPDAFVGLFDEHGFVNAQLTDNQGTFRFDGLPTGPGYYLKVDIDFDGVVDYPTETAATFTVPATAMVIPVTR